MPSLTELKAHIDFRSLVASSHRLSSGSKIHCPFHQDTNPSCHIYPDGFKCFGCGVYGDHVDWLKGIYGLTTAEAIEQLKTYTGSIRTKPKRRRFKKAFKPISLQAKQRYLAYFRATSHLPKALSRRGLRVKEALGLGIAAIDNDALLPIYGPSGEIMALKRRFYQARYGQRYAYVTAGHSSPAWCSLGFRQAKQILIVEGELNGMLSHLALKEAGADIAVMAPAGAQAGLYEKELAGKQVFVYADKDQAGETARVRWALQARQAGAKKIGVLAPFDRDACELAESQGRLYLASLWLNAMFAKRLRWLKPDQSQDISWLKS